MDDDDDDDDDDNGDNGGDGDDKRLVPVIQLWCWPKNLSNCKIYQICLLNNNKIEN